MLFEKILEMSLLGCYVILVVLGIRFLLKKCERKYSFLLWFVVFLNLCVPFSLEGPFSLIPDTLLYENSDGETLAKPQAQQSSQDVIYQEEMSKELLVDTAAGTTTGITTDITTSNIVSNDGNILIPAEAVEREALGMQAPVSKPLAQQPAVENHTEKITWQTVAGMIWLLGVGAIWSVSLLKAAYFSHTLRKNHTKQAYLEEGILCSEHISAPFLWGVFRPMIYLPANMGEEERTYIVAHEKCHKERFDHVTKPIAFIITSVHWFNPMVWLAYGLFVRDMEISCDEAVLAHTDADIKKQYASSLLKYAAVQNGFVLLSLTFGEPSLKSRIQNVLRYQKKGMAVTIATICVVTFTACGLIWRPDAEESTSQTSVESQEQEAIDDVHQNALEAEKQAQQEAEKKEEIVQEMVQELVEQQADTEMSGRTLNQDEITWFNESFFNAGYLEEDADAEDRMSNQFLTCTYSTPEEIDISEVFYNGMGEELTEEDLKCLSGEERWRLALYYPNMEVVSEEEHAQVAAISQELDVVKVSIDKMERVMERYVGIEDKWILSGASSGFYFNKADCVCYFIHGDTNALYIKVTDGYENADGTITLHYVAAGSAKWIDEATTVYEVVLKPAGDSYHFVSNQELAQ